MKALFLLLPLLVGFAPAPVEVYEPVHSVQIVPGMDEIVTVHWANGDSTTFAAQLGSGTNAPVCRVTWSSVTATGAPVQIEVCVPQKWGESDEDWAKRCAERVAAMQKHFPSTTGG